MQQKNKKVRYIGRAVHARRPPVAISVSALRRMSETPEIDSRVRLRRVVRERRLKAPDAPTDTLAGLRAGQRSRAGNAHSAVLPRTALVKALAAASRY